MQQENNSAHKVAIIMGSQSDWPTLKHATEPLQALEVSYETFVVSAHRTPDRLYEFARNAESQGYSVIIAGAGGAAHLPGMTAALTAIPVIAVPVKSKSLNGIDSLLSIVQMPKGIAVSTQAIGEAGAYNAGLVAAQIISVADVKLRERINSFRQKQSESVPLEVEQ